MKDQRERRFWQRLRKRLSPKVFVCRVENQASIGDPDVFLMKGGRVVWLELKWAEQPTRRTSLLLGKNAVRLDQINWHLSYASRGGTSFILIGTDGMDYLMPGAIADRLGSMSVDEMEAHAAHCCASIANVLEEVIWK